MMSDLRNRFISKAVCPEQVVTVAGEQFLVRGLTAKARNELYAAMPKKDDEQKMSGAEISHLEAEVVILCTFDPTTKQQVFRVADRDTLENLPGDMISALSGPAFKLSGMDAKKKDSVKNV